jgi:hydrogenase expression/formation protein HypE
MHDIAHATGLTVYLEEQPIPIHPPVRGVCAMLGYEPLYLACEGRVVAVVSAEAAPHALGRWRALPDGEEAAYAAEKRDALPAAIAQASGANVTALRKA